MTRRKVSGEVGVEPPERIVKTSILGPRASPWRERLALCERNPNTWVRFGPFSVNAANNVKVNLKKFTYFPTYKLEITVRSEKPEDPDRLGMDGYVYIRFHPEWADPDTSPATEGKRRRDSRIAAARRRQQEFQARFRQDKLDMNQRTTAPRDDDFAKRNKVIFELDINGKESSK